MTYAERGEGHGLYRVDVAIGVAGLYLSQYTAIRHVVIGIGNTLTRAGVEVETVVLTIDNGGDIYLVILKIDGYGVDEVLGRQFEVEVIAVHLRIKRQQTAKDDEDDD